MRYPFLNLRTLDVIYDDDVSKLYISTCRYFRVHLHDDVEGIYQIHYKTIQQTNPNTPFEFKFDPNPTYNTGCCYYKAAALDTYFSYELFREHKFRSGAVPDRLEVELSTSDGNSDELGLFKESFMFQGDKESCVEDQKEIYTVLQQFLLLQKQIFYFGEDEE